MQSDDDIHSHLLRHESKIAANERGMQDLKEMFIENKRENTEQHKHLVQHIEDVRATTYEIRDALIYNRGFRHYADKMKLWPLMIGGFLGSIAYSYKEAHEILSKYWPWSH